MSVSEPLLAQPAAPAGGAFSARLLALDVVRVVPDSAEASAEIRRGSGRFGAHIVLERTQGRWIVSVVLPGQKPVSSRQEVNTPRKGRAP